MLFALRLCVCDQHGDPRWSLVVGGCQLVSRVPLSSHGSSHFFTPKTLIWACMAAQAQAYGPSCSGG